MPLGHPDFYGTKIDGAREPDYCTFCFANGAFREPQLTVHDMVMRSIEYMVSELGIDRATAQEQSRVVIPGLKRWRE